MTAITKFLFLALIFQKMPYEVCVKFIPSSNVKTKMSSSSVSELSPTAVDAATRSL